MSREATVTAAGDLVELDESMAPEAVPAVVRQAAQSRLGAGAQIRYERVTLVLYEAEGEIGGRDREVLVSPTGRVGEPADDKDAAFADEDGGGGGEIERDDEEDGDGGDLDDDDEEEEEISLLEVPKKVIKAAKGAVSGLSLMEAEKRTTAEGVMYVLYGEAEDTEYEIVVTEKGMVVTVSEDD